MTQPVAGAPLPQPYGPPITLAMARRVVDAAEAEAAKHGWPMVIAIFDSTGHLALLHRMDQAQLGSVAVAQGKAETAVLFRRPSKVFEDLVGKGGNHLRLLAMPGMTPLEGGLPIMLNGAVIGGIGVSGMQSSQDQQVAEAGIAALS
jgi:uncharacterized protein GlcG (DUF336 family)